jgi:hypothetical protein
VMAATAGREDLALHGAPSKTEEVVQFHVGEIVTSLQKVSDILTSACRAGPPDAVVLITSPLILLSVARPAVLMSPPSRIQVSLGPQMS